MRKMLFRIALYLLVAFVAFYLMGRFGFIRMHQGLTNLGEEQGYITRHMVLRASGPRRVGQDLPVHAAAKSGDLEQLKKELMNGGNIEALDSELRTPLYLAVKFQHPELAEFLIKKGANVNSINLEIQIAPLSVAAQNNDVALIRLLIQNGAHLEQSSRAGTTPFLQAAWQSWHKDTAAAEALLAAGAKVNAADRSEGRAAHLAAISSHLKFLRLLALRRVDLNTKDINGNTPLMLAVKYKQFFAVKYLLALRVNPNLRDFRGWTPLTYALSENMGEIAKELIDNGANVNLRNLRGASPLYMAASRKNREVVTSLLAKGADSRETFNGEAITYWLERDGNLEMAKLIKSNAGRFPSTTENRAKVGVRRELKSFSGTYVIDDSGMISAGIKSKFSEMLNHLYNETGVDMRIALLKGDSKGNLSAYGSELFTKMGIGKEDQGRGVLFLYDGASKEARIEIGYGAEGFLPDILVNYVMRDNFLSLVNDGNLEWALRSSIAILSWRIREAILGLAFDPQAISLVANDGFLSGGAGAAGQVSKESKEASLKLINDRLPTEQGAKYHSPEEVYFAYIKWLADPSAIKNYEFLTAASVQRIRSLPTTKGYVNHILLMEFNKKFHFLVNDTMAVQVFSDSPLPCPHFYRKEGDVWKMDINSEIENAQSIVGDVYSWAMADKNNDFYLAFIDDLANFDNYIRFAVGDNRELPVRAMAQIQ